MSSNNSATAETLAHAVADIGVTIADSADPVTAGGAFTYLVSLTTAGPSEGNVHLTVPVSAGAVDGRDTVARAASAPSPPTRSPVISRRFRLSPSTVTIS